MLPSYSCCHPCGLCSEATESVKGMKGSGQDEMTVNFPTPSGTVVGIAVMISGMCGVWLCLHLQGVPVCL